MSQNKLEKCFREGMREQERHQGLRKIESTPKLIENYLKKALHNFEAMQRFHDFGYSDWSASAAFYTLYHGLLALLAQRGYESRNQSCTFSFIEDLIHKKELIYLTLTDLKEIFDKDITIDLAHSQKILDIREKMQYSTATSLTEQEFLHLKSRTKELLDKIRLEVERFVVGSGKLGKNKL